VQARDELLNEDSPPLAILDWMMPEMDGVEVCRLIRAEDRRPPVYIILLTAKETKENIVQGLGSGANDYVVKPFDLNELRARVQVGERMVHLQNELAHRVKELEAALLQVKQLKGLIPICAYCKKIRDDRNYWQDLEIYMHDHADVDFSHGVCPACFQKTIKELKAMKGEPPKSRFTSSGR
jgi:sigma-B regulation protein RsbU (phosphoserine phosphatase)